MALPVVSRREGRPFDRVSALFSVLSAAFGLSSGAALAGLMITYSRHQNHIESFSAIFETILLAMSLSGALVMIRLTLRRCRVQQFAAH